jgi:hypothetical protein
MKNLDVTVKSKDVVLGNVEVQEFETAAEAIAFFQAIENEAAAKANPPREADQGYGEKRVLELANSQHRQNICNAFRVAKTRGETPIAVIKNAVKGNKDFKDSLAALLAQYNLPANLEL